MKYSFSFLMISLFLCGSLLYSEEWRGLAATNFQEAETPAFYEKTVPLEEFTVAFNRANPKNFVKITNISNGKTIEAKVNGKVDDMRYIALLSPQAAAALDLFLEPGEVVIETKQLSQAKNRASSSSPKIKTPQDSQPLVQNQTAPLAENGPASKTKVDLPVSIGLPLHTSLSLLPEVMEIREASINFPYLSECIPFPPSQAVPPSPLKRRNVNIANSYASTTSALPLTEKKESFSPFYSTEIFESKTVALPEREKMPDPRLLPQKNINWLNQLEPNSIYITLLASSDKKRLESTYFNLEKLFGLSLGIRKKPGQFYDMLIGPIKEKELNQTIETVRNYGYKDAYIIRGK